MSSAAASSECAAPVALSPPCVPISYGSIAFNVGKGRLASHPDHTHKWTVFLRGAYNQDITYAISKVVFSLHPSFADHIRGAGYSRCCRPRAFHGVAGTTVCTNAHLLSPAFHSTYRAFIPTVSSIRNGLGGLRSGHRSILKGCGLAAVCAESFTEAPPRPHWPRSGGKCSGRTGESRERR